MRPSWQQLLRHLGMATPPGIEGIMELCQLIHVGRKIAGPMTICMLIKDADVSCVLRLWLKC